jgi:hypothetical protein
MTSHPNFHRTQAALNAARQGDYAPAFDAFTDDVRMENGPGAGPWHRARGKDDLALLLELASSMGETFRQDGRCVYADDRVAISLIHETGTAPGGDRFDNLAVYISRLRPDGQTERLWTVDLDAEHCEAFWAKTLARRRRTFPNSGSGNRRELKVSARRRRRAVRRPRPGRWRRPRRGHAAAGGQGRRRGWRRQIRCGVVAATCTIGCLRCHNHTNWTEVHGVGSY